MYEPNKKEFTIDEFHELMREWIKTRSKMITLFRLPNAVMRNFALGKSEKMSWLNVQRVANNLGLGISISFVDETGRAIPLEELEARLDSIVSRSRTNSDNTPTEALLSGATAVDEDEGVPVEKEEIVDASEVPPIGAPQQSSQAHEERKVAASSSSSVNNVASDIDIDLEDMDFSDVF